MRYFVMAFLFCLSAFSDVLVTDQQFNELSAIVQKAVSENRQIVTDNDDPSVIPKDRDRRLFREAMENLNATFRDRGVLAWIAAVKNNLPPQPPVLPNNSIWVDPVTQKSWSVLSTITQSFAEANSGCSSVFGNGWRVPTQLEVQASYDRLQSSGLANLEKKFAYWITENQSPYGFCFMNSYIATPLPYNYSGWDKVVDCQLESSGGQKWVGTRTLCVR